MNNSVILPMSDDIDIVELFGVDDKNLKIISKFFDVTVFQREDEIVISGDGCKRAQKVINELLKLIKRCEHVDEQKVTYACQSCDDEEADDMKFSKSAVCYTHMGKPISPKTRGQARYVKAIENRDIVFGIGPAGTGKTYLAVAAAASMLKKKQVEKIILARPAVEAGESLGFLPGDLQDKVDPYLRPLYDALNDIFGRETSGKLREKETIEVVPLAYMRGRTLDKACIILDEAQNTTREQMKMFLTRMGFYSKMIITGDITQIDLPKGKKSGLVEAMKILKDIDDIEFCHFKDMDVVRHQLVKKIIGAYDRYYRNEN